MRNYLGIYLFVMGILLFTISIIGIGIAIAWLFKNNYIVYGILLAIFYVFYLPAGVIFMEFITYE